VVCKIMLTDLLLVVVTTLSHLENDVLQRSALSDLPMQAMCLARENLTNVQNEIANLAPHVVLHTSHQRYTGDMYQVDIPDWPTNWHRHPNKDRRREDQYHGNAEDPKQQADHWHLR
jgi:hypothetical protein